MPRLIAQLKQKSIRELIALLFPIVAAIAAGGWTVFNFFYAKHDKPPPSIHGDVTGNGNFANFQNINNSTLNFGVPPSPEKSKTIIAKIAGFWGEGDCTKVAYSIVVQDSALIIDSSRWPRGSAPYHFVGTIQPNSERVIDVRGEKPVAVQGLSATFTYDGNSVIERLIWADHVANGTSVELNRCAS